MNCQVLTGIQGSFLETRAIVQLTIYLVKIGQDPFTYRFPVSAPIVVFNSEATEDLVAEDTKVVEKEAADSAADVEVPELGYGRIALGLVGGLPAVLAKI